MSSINRRLNKVCKNVAIDIGEELKQAYEESLREWWDKFVKWSKNSTSESSFSFLRAASSEYGKENFEPQLRGESYAAELNIDPSKMNAGLVHEWGSEKGKAFSDEDAFDMTYVKGVYGFNKEIVSNSWYKTKKSIRGYIARTGAPKDITRDEIISTLLKKRKFIPPIKRTSPDKIMKSKAKKILNRNHVEDIMHKYLKEAELFNSR